MKKEEWRSIKGYEGLYEVSDLGRVRSLEREDWIMPYWGCGERVKRVRAGKILIPRIGSNKYLRVCLSSHHCQKKDQQIHRLVATAFLPNQREKTQVNHKNGERNDNRLINLEWATASENIKHAYLTGLNKGRTGYQRRRC
jgi:hypothetical protein